jgi:hypothetical protein
MLQNFLVHSIAQELGILFPMGLAAAGAPDKPGPALVDMVPVSHIVAE